MAGTRWESGRIWSTATGSRVATRACGDSCAICAAPQRRKRGRSSRLRLGEECQVDYGTGPMVRDPDSGKYRRTRLFVLTLGWSRKSVRLLVFRSSARVWAELHEKAFRRLGGSPRIVVLDNLREGVLSPDFYDPGLNPLYRDVLAHYGVTALPCKVRDPDRKGKVESRRRPCAEDAAEGQEVREPGRGAGVSGPLGRALGRHAHPRPDQAAGGGDVRRREALTCSRFRSSRSATTSMASARCISMVASRLKRLTTVRRRAGSAGRSTCSGTRCSCVCSIPAPASCCASI